MAEWNNPPLFKDIVEKLNGDRDAAAPINDVLWAVTNELEAIYLNSETAATFRARLNELIDSLANVVDCDGSKSNG